MYFEAIALAEAALTNRTLVGLFTGVHPQVTLELECVTAGIVAVGTEIWAFVGVDSHVSLEFAQLD